MPNIPQYKYYLRFDDAGTWKYYYLDSNGDVQYTATKTPLVFTPSGWREKSLQLVRGFEYWGILRSFSLPLKFVKDGAKILRSLFYNGGIEAECQLYIEMFTNVISTWNYVEFYKGDIDFSSADDMKDYFTIKITESGFLSKFKAKEDTTKEIDVTNNANVIWVRMDGLDLQATANWTSLPNEMLPDIGINARIPTYAYVAGINNGINLNLIYKDNFNDPTGYVNFIRNYNNVTQVIDLKHSFYYNIFVDGGSPSSATFTLQYVIFDDNYATFSILPIYTAGSALSPGSSATYLDTLNDTITLPAGYSIACVIRMFVSPGVPLNVTEWTAQQLGSSISMELFNKVPPTYVPALRTFDVATELIQNINSTTTFDSTLLSLNEVEVLISGDALRNLDNAVLKTTIGDFHKAMNCQYRTVMKYITASDKVQIEKFEDIFVVGTPINIGEVASLEITPFNSETFTKLKIGFPLVNTTEINGKDDPNTELQFQSPITRQTRELNLVSPYHASATEIEIIRANLDGKKDADATSDNDVFWLKIESTSAGTVPSGPGAGQPYYNLYRDSGLTITGVLSPTTLFNVDFSPKRRLFTQGPFIKSVLYPLGSESIEFTSIGKSTNTGVGMVTDDGVTIITEKQSEDIADLDGNVLFYPFQFSISSHNAQLFSTLQTNPYKEIQFSYNGLDYYGWIIEFGDNPTADKQQEFKLLCSPTTDLTNLIV